MIETAVKGQPDDGYITDSLGWVLYRLGRYEEAVRAACCGRSSSLPDDPVINDHLGDVLWKVGRKREAEFQWRRALRSARPTTSTSIAVRAQARDRPRPRARGGSGQPGRMTGWRPVQRRPRARAGQGQSRPCTSPPGGRRLSLTRQPGGVRRQSATPCRLRAGRGHCRWTSTARSRAVAGRGQPRAARGGAGSPGGSRRRASADQGLPVASRHRRRVGRCRGGAAAAGAGLGGCRLPGPAGCWARRGRAGLPGGREPAGCGRSARPWTAVSLPPTSGWCWSIPACRCSTGAVFAPLEARGLAAARAAAACRRVEALAGWLAAPAQRPAGAGDRGWPR